MADVEELENTNVFQLLVLAPVIKLVDVYAYTDRTINPKEFCIMLFATHRRKSKKIFVPKDPTTAFCETLTFLQMLPKPLQNVIMEVFMNIFRYEGILSRASKDFLSQERHRKYESITKTMVLVYVLVYRINVMEYETANELFTYLGVTKVLALLSYLVQPRALILFCEIGCRYFEDAFVQERIVDPFLFAIPHLQELIAHLTKLRHKVIGVPKKPTVPVYLTVLTRPKKQPPVPPPSPHDLTIPKPAKPVPKSLYVQPSAEKNLAIIRKENKDRAKNLLAEAERSAPRCTRFVAKTSPKRIEEQEEQLREIKPLPIFKPVEVKHTIASMLRECATITSDEIKEVKKIKELAEGGSNPLIIMKLEEEERKRKKEEELRKIQEKHLTVQLVREGAYEAKESLLKDMQVHGDGVRKERQEISEKLERWKLEYERKKAEIVDKCHVIEQASRDAYHSMINEKRQKAFEVSEESRQLNEIAVKQREEDMKRKIQLVREIKALQVLKSSQNAKEFDPTESSGLGLLCEMSLAELKERLFWMKMQLNEEIECRRVMVKKKRDGQKRMVVETREALKEYKANKRIVCSITPSEQSPAVTANSPEIEDLQKKLMEKRSLRLRQQRRQ